MRKGWLILNSILLGLSLVVSIILIICVMNSGILDIFGAEAKLLIGVVSVLVAVSYNAIWGLLVEMANNIAKTGEQRMQPQMLPPMNLPQGQPVNNTVPTGSNAQPSGGVWKCSCGMENFNEAIFCQNCGARKN